MGNLKLLFQGIQNRDHVDAIEHLLALPDLSRFVASVAFLKKSGVDCLEPILAPHAKKTSYYVGIRNGITSVQGVGRLLELGATVIAFDTARGGLLFHPKIYLAFSDKAARGLIGSANSTRGGLVDNFEASAAFELDLTNNDDQPVLAEYLALLDSIQKSNPQHVFQITDLDEVHHLFLQGRLIDETIVERARRARIKVAERDDLSAIKTTKSRKQKPYAPRPKAVALETATGDADAAQGVPELITPQYAPLEWELVWTSKELTERDLNIPSGKGTNPTGSMLLKKGLLPDSIEFRTYFREKVFAELLWTIDKTRPKWERAVARFEVVIKELEYGSFDLQLSNFTDKDSETYKQHNAMTQLHWGAIKQYVAKGDLLNRVFYLYKAIPPVHPHDPKYKIEID